MKKDTISPDSRVVVMRYRSYNDVDFVRAHNEAMKDTGYCWLLKIGRPISTISLSQSFDNGALLVLRSPKRDGEKYYICHMLGYHNGKAKPDFIYPQYYNDLFKTEGLEASGTWIKIENISPLEIGTVNGLKLLHNSKPLRTAIQETRTVVLYAYYDPQSAIPKQV